jgi:hypothetical protein
MSSASSLLPFVIHSRKGTTTTSTSPYAKERKLPEKLLEKALCVCVCMLLGVVAKLGHELCFYLMPTAYTLLSPLSLLAPHPHEEVHPFFSKKTTTTTRTKKKKKNRLVRVCVHARIARQHGDTKHSCSKQKREDDGGCRMRCTDFLLSPLSKVDLCFSVSLTGFPRVLYLCLCLCVGACCYPFFLFHGISFPPLVQKKPEVTFVTDPLPPSFSLVAADTVNEERKDTCSCIQCFLLLF